MGQFKIKRNRKQVSASCCIICSLMPNLLRSKAAGHFHSGLHIYTTKSPSKHQASVCTTETQHCCYYCLFIFSPPGVIQSLRTEARRSYLNPGFGWHRSQLRARRCCTGEGQPAGRRRHVPVIHGHRVRAQQPRLAVSRGEPQQHSWIGKYSSIPSHQTIKI